MFREGPLILARTVTFLSTSSTSSSTPVAVLVACALPAARAAKVDPSKLMRLRGPMPSYHQVIHLRYWGSVAARFDRLQAPGEQLKENAGRFLLSWRFFVGWSLLLPLLAAAWSRHRRWLGLCGALALVFAGTIWGYQSFHAHYVAPLLGPLVLALVAGAERLALLVPHRRAMLLVMLALLAADVTERTLRTDPWLRLADAARYDDSVKAVSRSEEIHPADEMYRYSRNLVHADDRAARHLYFEKGRQIAEAVEQVARAGFGGLDQVPSLLDFASGFGRSTRFVARWMDPSRVSVCEIQDGAADFLRSTLGVDILDAAVRPENFAPRRPFSIIFASSFFSHCPPERFAGWLDALLNALESDGIFAFSVNDLGEAPPDAARSGPGFAFSPSSESDVLPGDEYGTTWVSEDHVRTLLADSERAGLSAERVPKGLCAHQDLWILRRGAAATRALGYERHPAGHVEGVASFADAVRVSGWAQDLDRPGGIERIVVGIEGRPEHWIVPASQSGSGRQTWSYDLSDAQLGLDDLVAVEAVAGSGRTSLLGVGSLRPFLAGNDLTGDDP